MSLIVDAHEYRSLAHALQRGACPRMLHANVADCIPVCVGSGGDEQEAHTSYSSDALHHGGRGAQRSRSAARRLRRVRCNGWFGVNVSLHAEIPEPYASALNPLFRHDTKPSSLEERPSRNTDLSAQVTYTSARGPRNDLIQQRTRNPLPLRLRMDVEKIETSRVVNSGKADEPIVSFTHEDAARFQAPSPRLHIGSLRRPGGDLSGRVVAAGNLMHRALKQRNGGIKITGPVRADHGYPFDAERSR